MAANLQLTGGLFQNPSGQPLANGYMLWKLSHDCQENVDSGGGQVASGVPARIQLDANGSIPAGTSVFIWSNDVLNPAGSFYIVELYDANQAKVWASPQLFQLSATPNPLDIGLLVPFSPPSPPFAPVTVLTQPTPTVSVGQIGLGTNTATSATAGTNGDVPAQVSGYIVINVAGANKRIPYYNP